MNVPNCYGKYGTGECGACEAAKWCKDAADPTTLRDNGLFVMFSEHLEDALDLIDDGENARTPLGRLFGELMYELTNDRAASMWEFLVTMSALSREHPNCYKAVRMRILHPNESYRALGDRLGVSREFVFAQLKKAGELVPVLRSAIDIPKAKLSNTCEETVTVRCGGGNIMVSVGDRVIMRMPMTIENGEGASLLAKALNNLHWRQKDALLNEAKEK